MTIVDKSYVAGKDFNGILRFLREETGGNIYKNGTVNITYNSIYASSNEADPESSVYETPRIENAFICFDFKERRIQLGAYSIMTISQKKGGRQLKIWAVDPSKCRMMKITRKLLMSTRMIRP